MNRWIPPLTSIPYKSRHNQFQLYRVIFIAATLRLPRTVQTCETKLASSWNRHTCDACFRIELYVYRRTRIVKLPFPLSLARLKWIEYIFHDLSSIPVFPLPEWNSLRGTRCLKSILILTFRVVSFFIFFFLFHSLKLRGNERSFETLNHIRVFL